MIPQQNGVAERKNQHLLEVVRALLIQAHMSLSYWEDVLAFASYLTNKVPYSFINFQTPFQVLNEAIIAPNISNLPPQVFGCVVFVHMHKHQRNKLALRALRGVFVGYVMHQKSYRYYHPLTKQMFIIMDVVFHEDTMYYYLESEFQGEYGQTKIQTLTYNSPSKEGQFIKIKNHVEVEDDQNKERRDSIGNNP